MTEEPKYLASLVLATVIHLLPKKVQKRVIYKLIQDCDIKLKEDELADLEEAFKPR